MIDDDNDLRLPEAYAAEQVVPMDILTEDLVRKMLRNAFQSGMVAGMDRAIETIKEQR